MLERLKHWLQASSPAVPNAPDTDATEAAGPGLAAREPTSTEVRDIVLIDVRSEREFHATAITRAVNLPLPQLEQRIRAVVTDTATPLVLYCASGARSGIACMMLKALGYTNVTNAGGLYAAAAQLQREVRR